MPGRSRPDEGTTARRGRVTVADIRARKGGAAPIIGLTANTAPIAKLLDPSVDFLLCGDSLGMVLYGLDSTVAVTLEMMIAHGAAVVRATAHACVVVDLPFGSYQASPAQAFDSAARVMKETGCAAVKLEGGHEMAETVRFLSERGVPVMGHVGLMPQRVHALGGFRTQGRDEDEGTRVIDDAISVAEAGAFSLVVEAVFEPLARDITKAVTIPTIGIGASPACDGQVLVTEDMIGLFSDFTPKFVKRYANVGPLIAEAAAAYAEEVRAGAFPGPEHCFHPKPKAGGDG